MNRFFVLVGSVCCLFCSLSFSVAASETQCDLYFSNNVVLHAVPLADDEASHIRGLSHRTDVGNGMLFSWGNAAPRTFWMHDTPVALTIGFFDANRKLFLLEDMKPNSDQFHFSVQPALYALELKSGDFQRHHLTVGMVLTTIKCTDQKWSLSSAL